MNDSISFTRVTSLAQALDVRCEAGTALRDWNDVVYRQLLSFFAMSALPFLFSTDSQPFRLRYLSTVRYFFRMIKACLEKPVRSLFCDILKVVPSSVPFPSRPGLRILLAPFLDFLPLVYLHFYCVLRLPTAYVRRHSGFVFSIVSSLFAGQKFRMFYSVPSSLSIDAVAVGNAIGPVAPRFIYPSLMG